MGRGQGLGRTVGHNMAPVPRRYPAMAPRGRERGSKSRLGPCPPPMGQEQDSSPGAGYEIPASGGCWRIDAWRMRPPEPNPTRLRFPELSRDLVNRIAADLGHYGMIMLLFETHSGFALFSFCGIYLFEPDAMENLWVNLVEYSKARQVAFLREFRSFDDKHSAINCSTGVSESLKNMILKHLLPGQKLAVGKYEYKEIIEKALGIHCLCGETVIEAMWGLQNHMHRLVPQERSLTKEDRLQMSHGLKKVLSRNGFDEVQPKMVNEQIMMAACALYECDYIDKKYSVSLSVLSRRIKRVSGIDTDHWSSLKCATAQKVIFCPEEVGDYHKMFSEDERSKLVDDVHKYARTIGKIPAMDVFEKMASANEVRNEKKILLTKLVTEAKERLMAQKVGG